MLLLDHLSNQDYELLQGLCELLQLKIILNDLQIKGDDLIKLYYDNKPTINIAHNPTQYDMTNRIEIIDIYQGEIREGVHML